MDRIVWIRRRNSGKLSAPGNETFGSCEMRGNLWTRWRKVSFFWRTTQFCWVGCRTFRRIHFFICNKTKQMHQFHKFILAWNSTCFGQFLCPSSGIYSLYTQQWCMSYKFLDSFQAGAYASARKLSVWHIQVLSVQWINYWWWTDELSETCRVSCQNKFVELVHLVGFIIKKFVTMHGHMNVIYIQGVTGGMDQTSGECSLC